MSLRYDVYGLYVGLALFPWVFFFWPGLETTLHLTEVTRYVLGYLPYLGLAGLAYLAFQLNQSRIVFTAVLLLAAYVILHNADLIPKTTFRFYIPGLLGLILPLTTAVFFSFGESYLWNLKGLGRIGLALLPSALGGVVFLWFVRALPYLIPTKYVFLGHLFYFTPVWILGMGALAALAFRPNNRGVTLFLEALFFALVPMLLVFHVSGIHMRHPELGHFILVMASLSVTAILLHAMLQMYHRRVYRDTLTDIPNRRALDETLIKLPEKYAIGMVDIDHFKSFNDTYGHEQGDDVLRVVARHFADQSGGRAFRYGGEEFCLLFKGWDLEKARRMADEIRDSLAKQTFRLRKSRSKKSGAKGPRGKKIQITVSIGLAAPTPMRSGALDVIRYADQALYQAKHKGRNRVEVAG